MASESEKRKINDLRVVDLRSELEKRSLDKTGVKAVLIERLQKALKDEGQDPEEFLFESSEKKTPSKKAPEIKIPRFFSQPMEGEKDNSSRRQNNGLDAKLDSHKMEQNEEADIKEEPKSEDKNVPETNGVDNEDSINLTIGEDEEKLLAEEEDSSSQDKESKANVEGATAPDGSGDAGQETAAQDTTEEKQESADKGNIRTLCRQDQRRDGPASIRNLTSKDDKEKKSKSGSSGSSSSSSSRNLWVSGLSSSTRATDLKQVFSKYGKVIGAKVVTNARTPGARCYGYVTMATSEDASKCIQHLHRTELHGRMISVERNIHMSYTKQQNIHMSYTKQQNIHMSYTKQQNIHMSYTKQQNIHIRTSICPTPNSRTSICPHTKQQNIHMSYTKQQNIHMSYTKQQNIHMSYTKQQNIHMSYTKQQNIHMSYTKQQNIHMSYTKQQNIHMSYTKQQNIHMSYTKQQNIHMSYTKQQNIHMSYTKQQNIHMSYTKQQNIHMSYTKQQNIHMSQREMQVGHLEGGGERMLQNRATRRDLKKKRDSHGTRNLFQDLIIIIIKTWNRSNKGISAVSRSQLTSNGLLSCKLTSAPS
ncbi:hypothetical protein L9F63_027477, partial [Diploptera punctata]